MLKLEDLTPEQFSFFVNYVYSTTRLREFPIDVANYTFSRANMAHDFAYWCGGKPRHRLIADIKFLFTCWRDMFRTVKLKYWFGFSIGILSYFIVIRAFGKFSFYYANKPASNWKEFAVRCNCVTLTV